MHKLIFGIIIECFVVFNTSIFMVVDGAYRSDIVEDVEFNGTSVERACKGESMTG
jgi:hypothetical protein